MVPGLRDVSDFTTACAYESGAWDIAMLDGHPRTSRRVAGELAELVMRGETRVRVASRGLVRRWRVRPSVRQSAPARPAPW
jgi:hypothetical protein